MHFGLDGRDLPCWNRRDAQPPDFREQALSRIRFELQKRKECPKILPNSARSNRASATIPFIAGGSIRILHFSSSSAHPFFLTNCFFGRRQCTDTSPRTFQS